jgi:hypothetical protein
MDPIGAPRMIAGEAPHLEMFFLSHRYGGPTDVDQRAARPPILFVSAYGPPGSYDPLARPQKPPQARVIGHARPLDAGVAQVGGPPTEEDELVVVRL